jgi:hypothetical protein
VTDLRLYLAIGLPIITNAAMFTLLFLYVNSNVSALREDIRGIREDVKMLTGAVNDLDRRLTRVEVKLGIQP